MTEQENLYGFDKEQAVECADAFSEATGLGCTLADSNGRVIHRTGCQNGCRVCGLLGKDGRMDAECVNTHLYGVMQAERFGGKYIYFCPSGLTWFVSPLLDEGSRSALLMAGPFLMVPAEEYLNEDLTEVLRLPADRLEEARAILQEVPYVSPERTRRLQTLLYMAVGYLNRTNELSSLIRNGEESAMAGQIGALIQSIKTNDAGQRYPFDLERKLLQAIREGLRKESQQLLNDILGYIFFQSGGEFGIIRARCCELVVLLSRASVDGGGDPSQIFGLNCRYIQELHEIKSVDTLCIWLASAMNRFMDFTFRFSEIGHVDVIRKSIDYMHRHYAEKITLEDVSAYVFLSPSYFSKVFKEEMGQNFNTYLNRIRIEKARQLLLTDNVQLVHVSGMVGFEDQSYFTKVFKKLTGVTPGKYRELRGQIRDGGYSSGESISKEK